MYFPLFILLSLLFGASAYGSSWCKECSSRTACCLSLRRGELCAVCYSIYNSCPVKLHFIVSTKMTLTLGLEQRPQKLIMKWWWYIFFCNWSDRHFFHFTYLLIYYQINLETEPKGNAHKFFKMCAIDKWSWYL